MTLSRSLIGIVAAAIAMLAGPTATAQDRTPAEIAQACVQRVENLATRTSESIGQTADNSVALINGLAENGAPDAVIRRAAREGIERAAAKAEAGVEKINHTVAVCARVLNELDAPGALVQGVLNAGQQARQAVREALATARGAIVDAAEAALAGD